MKGGCHQAKYVGLAIAALADSVQGLIKGQLLAGQRRGGVRCSHLYTHLPACRSCGALLPGSSRPLLPGSSGPLPGLRTVLYTGLRQADDPAKLRHLQAPTLDACTQPCKRTAERNNDKRRIVWNHSALN